MKTGRPIVLSLSPGPAHVDRAYEYCANANMWRITDDFWDNWDLLKKNKNMKIVEFVERRCISNENSKIY